MKYTAILGLTVSSMAMGQNFNWGSQYTDGVDAGVTSGGPLRRVTQIQNMVHTILCQGATTGCPVKAGHVTKALRNYGCNCFPENFDLPHQTDNTKVEYVMGQNGVGLDELDTACGDLHKAYKCILRDHADGKLPDPKPNDDLPSQNCGLRTGFSYFWDGNQIVCGSTTQPNYEQNGVPNAQRACQLAVCQIELDFAIRAADFIGNNPKQFRIDSKNNNMYGLGASGDAACFKNTGQPDACCGAYPIRFPYEQATHQCCSGNNADSVVKDLGAC